MINTKPSHYDICRKNAIAIVGALFAALILPASAISAAMAEEVAQGPNKEKCESVEKKVAYKVGDKPHICDFKCVYQKCDTSGKVVKNCARVTHWGGCEAVVESPKKEAPKKAEAPTKTDATKK